MKSISNINNHERILNISSKLLHSFSKFLMNISSQECETYHPYKNNCYFRDINDIKCTAHNKTFH